MKSVSMISMRKCRVVALLLLYITAAIAQINIDINTIQHSNGKDCRDIAPSRVCHRWALHRQCDFNKSFMYLNCKDTCGHCHAIDGTCKDNNIMCPGWADKMECKNNSDYMSVNCAKSCGLCVPAKYHDIPYVHADIAKQMWSVFDRQNGVTLNRGGINNLGRGINNFL